jgi:hypothetical protein
MMERKHREQASLFYEFRLDDMIPKGHLLRWINVFVTSVLRRTRFPVVLSQIRRRATPAPNGSMRDNTPSWSIK